MPISLISNAEAGSSVRTKLNETIRQANEVLNAVEYGCVGDGTTNNDTALLAMRTTMLADPSKTYRVFFAPGHYCYEDNGWLRDVERVIVDAYGVTFENIKNTASSATGDALLWGDPFGNFSVDGSGTPGHLFDSAAAGATTITLTTTAEHSNYAVGDRVLLHGYDQQQFGGFPPNLRYFDYRTITAIDTGTGVITFNLPLTYKYDDRWPDGQVVTGMTNVGKPRILSLDQASYVQPRFLNIKGVTFLANRFHNELNALPLQGHLILLEDVRGLVCWPTIAETAIFKRCWFQNVEPDKLLSAMTFEDCTFSQPEGAVVPASALAAASCVHNLTVDRCRILGRIVINPRHATFTSNYIYSYPTSWLYGVLLINPIWACSVLYAANNTFYHMTPDLNYMINTGNPNSLTVGSVDTGRILITWDATAINLIAVLEYGFTLTRNPAGKTGTITEIYHDGGSPGNLVIEVSGFTPVGAEVYEIYPVENQADGGGNWIVGTQIPIWGVHPERVYGLALP